MRAFRFAIAAIAAIALAPISGGAMAQAIKQIQLTEKQVQNYIASQKEIAALVQKFPGRPGEQPDPSFLAGIEAAAKKHGFASLAEFGDVSENISLLMNCIDPKTKVFSEPKVALQRDIDELKTSNAIPEPQKKQMLQDLNEALKVAEPIKYRSNIELVTKYYDQIDTTA